MAGLCSRMMKSSNCRIMNVERGQNGAETSSRCDCLYSVIYLFISIVEQGNKASRLAFETPFIVGLHEKSNKIDSHSRGRKSSRNRNKVTFNVVAVNLLMASTRMEIIRNIWRKAANLLEKCFSIAILSSLEVSNENRSIVSIVYKSCCWE